MRNPENTSERDPMIHMLGVLSDGSDAYIRGMEADGQRQLVHSDSLPCEAQDGDDAYLALGFAFGPAAGDPLFRPATLPQGWRKKGTDHDMWSCVLDEYGRRRVSVFYKAAFYDRRAFMRLETVRGYAQGLIDDGDLPIFDDTWCTPSSLRDALAGIRTQLLEYAVMYAERPDDAARLVEVREDLTKLDQLVALAEGQSR